MEIQGRKIKIVTGSKTQTVNVYGDNDTENVYSHKIRISFPSCFVEEDLLAHKKFATVEDLIHYLEAERHGKLEIANSCFVPPPLPRLSKAQVSASWCDGITVCVQEALNTVARDFLTNPYRHRVEHSLHCQLYMELLRYPELGGTHNISGYNVGYIHKEYPETSSRPDKNGRRGNFDMALLGPSEVTHVDLTIMDFLLGLIKPGIAIEVGLDYGASHLDSDHRKLKHSQIKRGYLLHLARATGNPQDEKGLDFVPLYQRIIKEEAQGGPQLVMCAFYKNECHLKLIGSPLSVTPCEK